MYAPLGVGQHERVDENNGAITPPIDSLNVAEIDHVEHRAAMANVGRGQIDRRERNRVRRVLDAEIKETLGVADRQHVGGGPIRPGGTTVVKRFNPPDLGHQLRMIPPAAVAAGAEIAPPLAHAAGQRLDGVPPHDGDAVFERGLAKRRTAAEAVAQRGRLIHLVEPELAVQPARFHQPARQAGAAEPA